MRQGQGCRGVEACGAQEYMSPGLPAPSGRMASPERGEPREGSGREDLELEEIVALYVLPRQSRSYVALKKGGEPGCSPRSAPLYFI